MYKCKFIAFYFISIYLTFILRYWIGDMDINICFKTEIMDGFQSSLSLKNHIILPNQIELFLSSTFTPLVVKFLNKNVFFKSQVNLPKLKVL